MSEEKYGFRIGQKVRLVSGGGEYPLNGYKNGNIYEIAGFHNNIDGDFRDAPIRLSAPEDSFYTQGFPRTDQLEPVTIPTTVTGPATITVAAGETIMFEGNATVKQDWVPKFGDRVTFVNPPSDMVGEFGVIVEIDDDDRPYKVTYNDGAVSDYTWRTLSEIKPYEAA